MTAFYMDLRCPFCFVQARRLPPTSVLAPRCVRTERDLPIPGGPPTGEVLESLRGYARRILEIDGTTLPIPAVWPNTRRASLALTAVDRVEPERAFGLAAALFQASWVDGRDISDPLVVRDCARVSGVRVPTVEPQDESALLQHDRVFRASEWHTPTLVSPSGAALVGLATRARTEAFLASGKLDYRDEDVCVAEAPLPKPERVR